MTYAENVYICIVMPLLVAIFFVRGNTRRYTIFFIIGMTVCLGAAYCDGFLAGLFFMDEDDATLKLAPVCEEILKMAPIIFYYLIADPDKKFIPISAVAIGVGFATLENCCYIAQFGASDLLSVLVRGLAAGTMHTVTAVTDGYGFAFAKGKKKYIFVAMVFGLICIASSYHAVYNILVFADDARKYVGYLLPMLSVAAILTFKYFLTRSRMKTVSEKKA